MLPLFINIVVTGAFSVGFAFILSEAVPRNKLFRFVCLFGLFVPFSWFFNYVYVRTLGYHKMGWSTIIIFSFLIAALGTLFGPQPNDSRTR